MNKPIHHKGYKRIYFIALYEKDSKNPIFTAGGFKTRKQAIDWVLKIGKYANLEYWLESAEFNDNNCIHSEGSFEEELDIEKEQIIKESGRLPVWGALDPVWNDILKEFEYNNIIKK